MDYEHAKNEILFKKITQNRRKKNKRFPLILGINALLTYIVIVLMIIFII